MIRCTFSFWTALLLFQAIFASQEAAAATTLSITAPTANLRVTNDAFTVTGTTADPAGVTNVFYLLNNSSWANASTTNGWTNWSAQVSLAAGTNKFSVYAVNTVGANSKTNTVKLFYVVMDVLTVRTNGHGTVSPAYDGALLQIGVNYSITATPTKPVTNGYGLVSWTDGNSNVVGRSPKLTFMMASNLTLTANFGDASKPVVKVLMVTTNSNGNPNSLIFTGSASDNVAVTNVYYQLINVNLPNSNNWIPVVDTTNNWKNWTITVNGLQPGTSTFNVYALDSSGNSSYVVPVTIYNNTAPKKLSGLVATVKPDDTSIESFSVAFGAKTFTEVAHDSHNVNGAGSYTYKFSGGNAALTVKYVAPKLAASTGSRTFELTFITPNLASYSTTNVIATNVTVIATNNSIITTNTYATNMIGQDTGFMYFSTAPKLAIASPVNQLFFTLGNHGSNDDGILFQKKTYTSYSLIGQETNGGSYTYSLYSPISGLFKLTNTNGTEYVLATFANTNYGSYYSESYDTSGHTNEPEAGRFMIQTQHPGGNAPATVASRAFQIFSGEDTFNVVLGTNTYSQDTLSTNFDNAVGDYAYTRPDTNIGQLDLTVTAPPSLAGSNNTARLIFVGGNVGMFTNEDSSLSSFVMTTATNFVPATITDTTLTITNSPDGFVNQLQFTNDGSFYFNGSLSGTYTYTIYSPAGAMIQATFTNAPVQYDWLQLNFKTTNSGSFFVNEFNDTTNFLDNVGGDFDLH
jgi:hypothetical protein